MVNVRSRDCNCTAAITAPAITASVRTNRATGAPIEAWCAVAQIRQKTGAEELVPAEVACTAVDPPSSSQKCAASTVEATSRIVMHNTAPRNAILPRGLRIGSRPADTVKETV